MNNIAKIIIYLSGEMDREEASRFELLRSTDPELENEFQSVRKIWELTRENLMLEDLPEEKIRDQLIAEVLAHHDIAMYGDKADTKNTESFRTALRKAESAAGQEEKQQHSRLKWANTTTLLLAAASLVLLVLVLRPSSSLQELAVNYYDPSGSNLALQHAFKTRSNEARALQFFRNMNYDAAEYYFEISPETIEKDPMARLFYGISCYENGDLDKALAVLEDLADPGISKNPDSAAYHASWYMSLILLKEGKIEDAIPYLVDLSRSPGPYNKKSTKLLRKTE